MVVMAITPLAAAMRWTGTISGMLPYFEGLNIVLWAPIRNSTMNISQIWPLRITRMPRIMIAISASLHPIITSRLLKRSAR